MTLTEVKIKLKSIADKALQALADTSFSSQNIKDIMDIVEPLDETFNGRRSNNTPTDGNMVPAKKIHEAEQQINELKKQLQDQREQYEGYIIRMKRGQEAQARTGKLNIYMD